MSRKPSPGVCKRCGRAVVRATPERLEQALDASKSGDVWINGHHYVDRKLVDVACREHEPRDGWDTFC